MRIALLFFSCLLLSQFAQAQTRLYTKHAGMRFATNLNYFHQAKNYGLVDGWFSSFVVGGFYRHYTDVSGVDVGFNLNYKSGSTGFKLPVLMQDFKDGQQTAITALEMDVKVGPRFGAFNPRIGYVLGYRLQGKGFLSGTADTRSINKMYLNLPFGCSADFPTNYGLVGVGVYYQVGIMNVIQNKGQVQNAIYDGGKARALTIEITTTLGMRK